MFNFIACICTQNYNGWSGAVYILHVNMQIELLTDKSNRWSENILEGNWSNLVQSNIFTHSPSSLIISARIDGVDLAFLFSSTENKEKHDLLCMNTPD